MIWHGESETWFTSWIDDGEMTNIITHWAEDFETEKYQINDGEQLGLMLSGEVVQSENS